MHTLQIGQWNDRKIFNVLHWGQHTPGFYKYSLCLIAYLDFNVASSISTIPAVLNPVNM